MALKPLKKPKAPVFKSPVTKGWKPSYVRPVRESGGVFKKPKNPYGGFSGPVGESGRGDLPWKPPTVPKNPAEPIVPTAAPDYGSLISGDWEVQLAESDMASKMAAARGNFQSMLRQHLIDLGISDVSKLGNLGQYIDNETIQAAVNNKYSTTAQIAQGAERSRAGNNAALAARGMLSSGQTTKSQQDVTAQAEAGRFSALREFLTGGASGLSGLADLESGLAGAIARARGAAAGRAADIVGVGADTPAPSPAAAARAAMLNKRAWMAKHPGGKYANYVRAYKRHQRLGK